MDYSARENSDANAVPDASLPASRIRAAGPDFICIGMGSSGTGWLWDQLRFHPEFWMPPIKEFGYLLPRGASKSDSKLQKFTGKLGSNKYSSWSNRRPDDTRDKQFLDEVAASSAEPISIERYVSFFRFKENALSGEITPGYARLQGETIAALARHIPRAKIILLVRDPLERAWSRVSKRFRKGLVGRDVVEDRDAFLGFIESRSMGESWFPTKIASCWKQHAPNLDFRAFLFDDIAREPDEVRRQILLYLGADAGKSSRDLTAGHNRKAGREKVEPSESVRGALLDYFGDELLACADFFGGAAREWPKRYGL